MEDPVICDDGRTYDRLEIILWISLHGLISPLNSFQMLYTMTPDVPLRNAILQYQSGIETVPFQGVHVCDVAQEDPLKVDETEANNNAPVAAQDAAVAVTEEATAELEETSAAIAAVAAALAADAAAMGAVMAIAAGAGVDNLSAQSSAVAEADLDEQEHEIPPSPEPVQVPPSPEPVQVPPSPEPVQGPVAEPGANGEKAVSEDEALLARSIAASMDYTEDADVIQRVLLRSLGEFEEASGRQRQYGDRARRYNGPEK
jgi:hypothetical protein